MADLSSEIPLVPGSIFVCSFVHTDPQRQSYDRVDILLTNNKELRMDKPKSADAALRKIVDKQDFFLQDSALSRINEFFSREFSGMELITGAKILTPAGGHAASLATTLVSPCPKDVELLVEKAVEEENEIQEIEIVAVNTKSVEKIELPGGTATEQLMIRSVDQYHPLTVDQIIQVLHIFFAYFLRIFKPEMTTR